MAGKKRIFSPNMAKLDFFSHVAEWGTQIHKDIVEFWGASNPRNKKKQTTQEENPRNKQPKFPDLVKV